MKDEARNSSSGEDRIRWGVFVLPSTIHTAKVLAATKNITLGQLRDALVKKEVDTKEVR